MKMLSRTNGMGRWKLVAGMGVATLVGTAAQAQETLGPVPYLCAQDSPFNGIDFRYYHIETFEDHLLNTPGITATGGVVTSVITPNIHDSVDCDDGMTDGSGLLGDSYFAFDGSVGARFTFNATALGFLPTHVGLVWTDGGGDVTLEAFDANGASLGSVTGDSADGSVNGETAEDRFYGVIYNGGISSILLRSTAGGMELDHVQYGGIACIPDYNMDGSIDISDTLDLVNDIAAGTQSFPPNSPDFNRDGSIDLSDAIDLGAVVGGEPCP